MSDEAPDLPDTPTSTTNSDTPEIPWQKRYEDLRPEFDRTRQELASERGLWDDEQAALSRFAEKFPHLMAGEDEEEPEEDYEAEDDPVAPIRSEMEQFRAWQQQVENERGAQRFERDLTAELGDEKVPAKVTDWIKDRTAALGNNPDALKKAVQEYREFAAELGTPKPKPKPRAAPHVIAKGETVTGGKAWADMTSQEALEAQLELARQLDTQI